MDFDEEVDLDPEPASLRELRILVLHNRDFESESSPHPDLELTSRADVANSAQSVARALAARGHFVEVKGIDLHDIGDLVAQLREDRPDLVFNLCESLAGQDRHQVLVPALLDLVGVAYTGSSALCLGLCLAKYQTKQILRAASIPTPPAAQLSAVAGALSDDLAAVQGIGYPLFLKLAQWDGSVGISKSSIVHSDEELVKQLDHLRTRYKAPILAERFIDGRELYVALLGSAPPRLLPMQEIDFSELPSEFPRIVSENAKWNPASPEYQLTPSVQAAPMPAAVRARVEEVAARTFAALDIWDYGRCDFRLSADGTPYVIDVNPNCDLGDGAGYSRAAGLAGLSYDRVIEKIALAALQRNAHVTAQRRGAPPSGSDSVSANNPARPL